MAAGRVPEEGDHDLGPALLLLSPLTAAVDVIGAGARAPVRVSCRQYQPGGALGAPLAS